MHFQEPDVMSSFGWAKLLIPFDLFPELWGEMFEPLKDKALFSTVRLDATLKTIAWQNGTDFAPEFLLELLEQQTQTDTLQHVE